MTVDEPSRKRSETELDRVRGKRIKDAREAIGLSQSQLATKIGVDVGTLSRWERGYPVKPRDVAGLAVALGISPNAIDRDAAKSLGEKVARGTLPGAGVASKSQTGASSSAVGPSGERFPFALILRRPAVRAQLNAIQRELIEAGAPPEAEESVMRTIQDRQRIARFAGGSIDDLYTEAEVVQVIENIADAAFSTIGIPRERESTRESSPDPSRAGEVSAEGFTHERISEAEIAERRRNARKSRGDDGPAAVQGGSRRGRRK